MKYGDVVARKARELYRRLRVARLDGVSKVRARHRDFGDLRDQIRRAGTDSLSHFGNEFAVEGGLSLQQNPDEFAALCLFLQERAGRERYLEIGSASGGACLFLHRRLGFSEVLSIDDGMHPRATEQPANFAYIPGIRQYTGDSHAPEAARFLREELSGPIDVAFIDGDHSYDGVMQDIRLVEPFLRSGSLVIFHDTVAVPDVEMAWRMCTKSGRMRAVAEFIGDAKPLGIGVAEAL
jgi:predicted O-methyltransferase YrrM